MCIRDRLDIAAAGETPIEGIHSQLIVDRMSERGHQGARYWPQRSDIVEYLSRTADEGDIIVTMGAGDVWKLARELAQAADQPLSPLKEAR